MNIKDCITLCTRMDHNQVRKNVKWSTVPKENNQLPQHRIRPLPSHLELEKDLHDQSNEKHSKGKKHKNYNKEKDQGFQVFEIRRSIQEVGIGWGVLSAVEKRYRDSQKDLGIPSPNQSYSGSNVSFVSLRTTTTTISEDSFLSASQDCEQLKTSEENVQSEIVCTSKEDKERYKRNALIKGILQTKKMNHPLGENESTDCFAEQNLPDLVKKIDHDKENQNINKKMPKKMSKALSPRRKSIKKDAYQDNLTKSKATENSRAYFMSIPDEDMGFVSKKSTRKSKKSVKPGCFKF